MEEERLSIGINFLCAMLFLYKSVILLQLEIECYARRC